MTRLRAKFDGKVLIPIDPVVLPQGRVLDVQVSDGPTESRSVESILRAVSQPPHVADDIVDELERAIDEAKLPVRFGGVFDGAE